MLAPTRATALTSALADYRGWHLFVHCACCRVLRQLPVSDLADRVGSAVLLQDIVPRLRCQRCGDPPRAVKLSDGGGSSVWLLGSA